MKIESLTACPDGLKAVYLVLYHTPEEVEPKSQLAFRPVDALASLVLEPPDQKEFGASLKVPTKLGSTDTVVGLILEGSIKPVPAPLATNWLKQLFAGFIGARFLGYTRFDSEISNNPVMREFWVGLGQEAQKDIVAKGS